MLSSDVSAGYDPSYASKCGAITITTGVTRVTATAGTDETNSTNSIGTGEDHYHTSCGTVTIGGTVYDNGVTTSTFTYPISLTYPIALNAVTSDYVGSVITTDGYVYATVVDATMAKRIAAAIIVYVGNSTDASSPYTNGLAIALSDESGTMTWSTASTTCSAKAAVANASWMLPSLNQWLTMFKANGGSNSNWSGLNTTITNAGGTTLQPNGDYWTSTDYNNNTSVAWGVTLSNSGSIITGNYTKNENSYHVRACLAF